MEPCELAVSKTYLATEGSEVLVVGTQKPQRDTKGLRVQ